MSESWLFFSKVKLQNYAPLPPLISRRTNDLKSNARFLSFLYTSFDEVTNIERQRLNYTLYSSYQIC